jgi:anti-anti-sigma factor
MGDLQVVAQHQKGRTVFVFSGRLDLRARDCLRKSVEAAWDGLDCVRLDVSAVDEVDLSGLSWLMMADDHMRQRGGRLEIVAASPALQRALALLRPATRALSRVPAERSDKIRHRPRRRLQVRP